MAMTQDTPTRKYALTRIGKGDYLLPGNDRETLWRIASYEDGPGHGLEVDWSSDRTFWGVWKYEKPLSRVRHPQEIADAVEDWGVWSMEDGSYYTRREAIDRAMRLEASQ